MHTVRRHQHGAQATCIKAGPGSESGAKAYGGILESWEGPHHSLAYSRTRMTPGQQHPGAWAELSATHASEAREAARESAGEGNRSGRVNGGGRLSGLIVAFENRVTNRREPVSSEGDHRGEEGAIWAKRWGDSASIKRLTTLVAHSLRERILSHEEPDALIALVRVCGGVGGQPPALPGDDHLSESVTISAHQWLRIGANRRGHDRSGSISSHLREDFLGTQST